MRNWGATEVEQHQTFACDRHLNDGATLFRAIDVAAPPHTVFRWLCQLRAAPYAYDVLDNWGKESPRQLTPGLDHLQVGQRFMKIFELVDFEPGRHITLRLDRATRLLGPLVVTYRVLPHDHGSRLVVKLVSGHAPGPVATALAWGDYFMMKKQLLTLKALAEAPPL